LSSEFLVMPRDRKQTHAAYIKSGGVQQCSQRRSSAQFREPSRFGAAMKLARVGSGEACGAPGKQQ
jgi:hypothetical protein